MKERSPWEEFFDGHAPHYMENVFTRNTVAEVDFVVRELELGAGAPVLDLGCGTGRHSIELARRGFRVTGVDLSEGMLKEASKAAAEAVVEVTWIQADATRLSIDTCFDGAICLCEGAFGLLDQRDQTLEQPLAILRGLSGALRPGGRCLLTVLNGFKMARQNNQRNVEEGRFDPLSLTEVSEVSAGPDRLMLERGFVPTELRLLFQMAGFEVLHLGGGTAGNWGFRPLELDEYEILILARRGEKGAG